MFVGDFVVHYSLVVMSLPGAAMCSGRGYGLEVGKSWQAPLPRKCKFVESCGGSFWVNGTGEFL